MVNGDVPNTDLITRKTITKSSLHVKTIAMYAKLFENDSVGCEDNDLIREEEEEHVTISEQLDRVVAESTQQKDNQPTQRVPLRQDFQIVRGYQKISERLEKLFQALLTTTPTSVES